MKNSKRLFYRNIRILFAAILCLALLLTGCGSVPKDGPGSAAAGSGSENPDVFNGKETGIKNGKNRTGNAAGSGQNTQGTGLAGTWYEQDENGGVLTVTKTTLTYDRYGYEYRTGYTLGEKNGTEVEVIPDEEFWILIDILYDSGTDTLTGHDMPHTDGDGGYHLHTFLKTEYVAPPETVYGERIDHTDPDAKKDFTGAKIKDMTFYVYEPIRNNGDMAPEEPVHGEYSYELVVQEDGSAILSSDFCQDITVTEEEMEELETLFATGSLPSLNGIDVITEEMPEGTNCYELSITFADGSDYYSHANGRDVSMEWLSDGFTFHQYLFELFRSAGYNSSTGEFHSTEPMKRFRRSSEEKPDYTITSEAIRTTRDGTVYDYDVYSEYPVFTAEGEAPKALMDTLGRITEDLKERALYDLEENDALMAGADKSVWKKADRRYAYSFYSPMRLTQENGLFRFWISEGHANSLGIGKYEYGYYPHYRYAIDEESGRILCAQDLFNDPEELNEAVIDMLCKEYGYSEKMQEFYTSEAFRKALEKGLSIPETEGGIGFDPEYDGITFYFSEEYSRDGDYSYSRKLYYDSIQDLMKDQYSSVWG